MSILELCNHSPHVKQIRRYTEGTRVKVAYPRGKKQERLSVKIPPGVKPGTKLRLANKGLEGGNGALPGDLYLRIEVSK